ncbi:MAG TPA: ferrous iron transport protein A [Acholeplasma sp.]|jgi:ferrous iron transport protein A|nr:ferrous iron transport protein A [Acholeplasma sp.]
MKLIDLQVGESLKVTNIIDDKNNIKKRLNDLGITKSVVITIKGFAPFGSPVNISLRGYNLAIDKKYLNNIEGVKV